MLSILKIQLFFLIPLFSFSSQNSTPPIDGDKLGAWYMYFFNTTFKESQWGIQGDIQYRNWNLIGDLEQLLLRGGVTFKPKETDIKFTLGYGNITTGAYGIENYSKNYESRIYQEVLYPVKFGKRFILITDLDSSKDLLKINLLEQDIDIICLITSLSTKIQ